MKIENILKTPKDFEIWDRLIKDMNYFDGFRVSNSQVMKQWDLMYKNWFSKGVDIKMLKEEFKIQVFQR